MSNPDRTSQYEPVEAGDAPFHELVGATAARRPDRLAIDGRRTARSAPRVDRVAATLARRGFRPGDVLALEAPNLAPWAVGRSPR